MSSHYKIFLFFFSLLSSISSFSQDLLFNIQFFDQDDGLSDRSIYCVNQDDSGLIWIGTGNGLNQFDGRNFRVVGEQNSITSTGNIYNIYKKDDGSFWMQKGHESVVCFDPYKEEVIPVFEERDDDLRLLKLESKGGTNTFFTNKKNTVFFLDKENKLHKVTKSKNSIENRVNGTSWNTVLIDDWSIQKKIEINFAGDTLRVFDTVVPGLYDDGKKYMRRTVNEVGNYKYINEVLLEIKEEGDFNTFKTLLKMAGLLALKILT